MLAPLFCISSVSKVSNISLLAYRGAGCAEARVSFQERTRKGTYLFPPPGRQIQRPVQNENDGHEPPDKHISYVYAARISMCSGEGVDQQRQ